MHAIERQTLPAWIASLPPAWIEGCDLGAVERAHSAYQSAGRHYHTWEHVVACVEQLRTFPCESPRTVFLALLFHDAIYIPGRSDNERESAVLARESLSAMCSMTASEVDAIDRMILATRDHHAQAGTLRTDETVMLDIDLSILAAARDDYAHYARAVHDEYVPAVATEARFRVGRLEFLRRTLAMPYIFLTAEARRRWEDGARANMAWEATELARQQGVLERWISALRKRP